MSVAAHRRRRRSPRRAALLAALVAASGCRGREEIAGPPSPDCALQGLDRGAVPFVLETGEGVVRCTLDGARAPRAVGMIVALAEGRAPFRDPVRGAVVRRPYYDGLPFFRAIAGGLVQTGCPLGNGTGHPGYRISVEPDPSDAARLSRPGALFLARYTAPLDRRDPAPPPPGEVMGSQLVVSLVDMSHLAGKVTVLGACANLDVVRRISDVVAREERRVGLLRARVEGAPGGGPCPAAGPRREGFSP